jgi:hypothetical protein
MKTGILSFKVEDALRDAIGKAAADDRRSVSSWVTLALEQVLREKGYFPAPKTKR